MNEVEKSNMRKKIQFDKSMKYFVIKREWATTKQLKEMKKELDKAPKIVITKKVEL